jgi:tripartite ATP-independent transporter DctP family solute receptor
MKDLTKRGLLAGIGGVTAAALLPGRARAAEFSFRFATDVPSAHPAVVALKDAIPAIEAEAGGRLEIKLLPDGQLGTSPEMLNQVRSGAVDMTFMSTGQLSTLVPVMTAPNLAFAFPDYATLWSAMDGTLGTHLLAELAKTNAFYTHPRVWDVGFRNITTSAKPVKEPGDLAGLKIRVPPNKMATSLFSALGAAPAPLPFPELYSALAAHLVDGQENPLSLIQSGKLFEVQKHCTLSRHMWEGWYALVANRSWRRLPDDLKAIVARNLDKAALAQREASARQDLTLQADLAAKGLNFVKPDAAVFRKALAQTSFYADWKAALGAEAWTALEGSVGKLG